MGEPGLMKLQSFFAVLLLLISFLNILSLSTDNEGPIVFGTSGFESKKTLLYYGNGGPAPGHFPDGQADFSMLQDIYNLQGCPATYTAIWPNDLTTYRVIFLIMPGNHDHAGSSYFTQSQIQEIREFLLSGGRLVVQGDHSGGFGIDTVNRLLSDLGLGIQQNGDKVLVGPESPATDITPDQITDGVVALDFNATSTFDITGAANSLVRDHSGDDVVVVEHMPLAPPRPGGDVLVWGDTQVLDNYQLQDNDGDGPHDNLRFADNIAMCSRQLPNADAGLDQTVGEGDVVTLDGSASIASTFYPPSNQSPVIGRIMSQDYEDSAILNGGIVSYEWDFESDGVYDYAETPVDAPDGAFDGMTTHVYGDDGVYYSTLRVSDDTGARDTDTCKVTVSNVAPVLTINPLSWDVEIGLRVAGRKYNDVGMTVYEDGIPAGSVWLERSPGSPKSQTAFLRIILDPSKFYNARVTFTPEDPPNLGGNPVWVYVELEDGTTVEISHTFNVQQSRIRGSSHWNHIEPWDVNVTSFLPRNSVILSATGTDPGSDDLGFRWSFQTSTTWYNNDGSVGSFPTDPYPSSDGVTPFSVTWTVIYAYSGPETLVLTVEDDDGGLTMATIDLG